MIMHRMPATGHSILARRVPLTRKFLRFLPSTPTPTSPTISASGHGTMIKRTFFGPDEDEISWWHTDQLRKKVAEKQQIKKPGSKAFVSEIEENAVMDLFFRYAKTTPSSPQPCLDLQGVRDLLDGIGESHDDETVRRLFADADIDGSGGVDLEEFLMAADKILGDAPARIVIIVGGPGSGKGVLSQRLEKEAGLVHLSSGDLLRQEVKRGTVLGKQVQEIMSRGELVSSEIIVTLMKRRMRDHPGKRVLLDGFPRSLENALDLVELCGKPELALHLECDDTVLMERIVSRGEKAAQSGDETQRRPDDNFHTALKRLRTYHKYHRSTIQFLREQHVPIVELDCSVTPDLVWEQLMAIGRMMRPAVKRASKVLDEPTTVPQLVVDNPPRTGTTS